MSTLTKNVLALLICITSTTAHANDDKFVEKAYQCAAMMTLATLPDYEDDATVTTYTYYSDVLYYVATLAANVRFDGFDEIQSMAFFDQAFKFLQQLHMSQFYDAEQLAKEHVICREWAAQLGTWLNANQAEITEKQLDKRFVTRTMLRNWQPPSGIRVELEENAVTVMDGIFTLWQAINYMSPGSEIDQRLRSNPEIEQQLQKKSR